MSDEHELTLSVILQEDRKPAKRRDVNRKEQDTLTTKIQNDTTKSKTTLTCPTEY